MYQMDLFQYMIEETRLKGQSIICPQCNELKVMELNCKRICTNCGYKEDCSDLFVEELTHEPRV